jgi:hypothetical protein
MNLTGLGLENDCTGEAQQQLTDPSSRQRECYIRTIDCKGSVEKNAGRESQGAWCQDEMIGGKRPVIKQLSL